MKERIAVLQKCQTILFFVLFGFAVVKPVEARVYTTRPGDINFDNPESFGAKEIYGGQFRINGHLAEMKILAGTASVTETLQKLGGGNNDDPKKGLRYRASKDTVVGAWGQGASERRFLISSVGSTRSCLVFILKGESGLFEKQKVSIPWPSSLPVLDPMQEPQLVVEHVNTEFIFAAVIIPQANVERALQMCQEHLADSGWAVEPLTEKFALQIADSGFALLAKKGKVCWLEAKPGSSPNQVLITLLCKKP